MNWLTHWGRVTHICVGKLTIIASDNGLSPGRRQAIIWTNDGILLIGPLGTNFNEILIDIHKFSFKKMHLKMSSAKWRPFCLGPNVLNMIYRTYAVLCPRVLPHYQEGRCYLTGHIYLDKGYGTVKPVYNDHLMRYFSAFWCSSRWARAT